VEGDEAIVGREIGVVLGDTGGARAGQWRGRAALAVVEGPGVDVDLVGRAAHAPVLSGVGRGVGDGEAVVAPVGGDGGARVTVAGDHAPAGAERADHGVADGALAGLPVLLLPLLLLLLLPRWDGGRRAGRGHVDP